MMEHKYYDKISLSKKFQRKFGHKNELNNRDYIERQTIPPSIGVNEINTMEEDTNATTTIEDNRIVHVNPVQNIYLHPNTKFFRLKKSTKCNQPLTNHVQGSACQKKNYRISFGKRTLNYYEDTNIGKNDVRLTEDIHFKYKDTYGSSLLRPLDLNKTSLPLGGDGSSRSGSVTSHCVVSGNKYNTQKGSNNLRVSLLGKPLGNGGQRTGKSDFKYRKHQAIVYNFLERPTGKLATSYHVAVFIVVFLCLGLTVVSTIEDHEYEAQVEAALFNLEMFIVAWFGIEFVIRVWSSGCRSKFQGFFGRLRFMRSPFCIIDVITVCASVVVLTNPDGRMFAASALRGLRFFQILRMVRMDRRGGTWKLLGSVVFAHRQELITTIYIGFLGLVFSSFLIYMVEKDGNPHFKSFAHSLWWGVITLCTVGYGDAVPMTWKGKMIASFCALLGISFFALPAGILGSGFALKVQQQQRQKHMIRRRVPAATLIQCLWRCYAADENSCSEATWKIHMVPHRSPPPFKSNNSFVRRLNTLRRGRSSMQSPGSSNKLQALDTAQMDALSFNDDPDPNGRDILSKRASDDDGEFEQMQPIHLTQQHKGAIRAIRKLKYLRARKQFKEALKPYDVKDVIESYSAGHADLACKVKGLQTRLDVILGRQGSKSKDVYESKQSLASRIVKTERQVDDIEDKLDRLIAMYEEDRKRFSILPFGNPNPPPGTPCPSSPSPPYHIQLPINQLNSSGYVIQPDSLVVDSISNGKTVLSSPQTENSLEINPKKRPVMKKRVTLSIIPAEYISNKLSTTTSSTNTIINGSKNSNQESAINNRSIMNMNPPSVRIEGCTPPSDMENCEKEVYTYVYGDSSSNCNNSSLKRSSDNNCPATSSLMSTTEIVITPAGVGEPTEGKNTNGTRMSSSAQERRTSIPQNFSVSSTRSQTSSNPFPSAFSYYKDIP